MFDLPPAHYLPHRYPFLLLDRIMELEPGVRAVATLGVSSVFPPILMIESVGQLAGIVIVQPGDEQGFMASINHAEFSGSAVVGDNLIISAWLIKSFGRLFRVEGDVVSDGNRLLTVQMTIGIGAL